MNYQETILRTKLVGYHTSAAGFGNGALVRYGAGKRPKTQGLPNAHILSTTVPGEKEPRCERINTRFVHK